MKDKKRIQTDIKDVEIIYENIISDERGTFFDLVENEFYDQSYKEGVKHVYATVTNTKLVARGNHFHYKNFENFFPLTGVALWILLDNRKESPTFGKIFSFITSYKKYFQDTVPVFSVEENKFIHFTVPPGIYHLVAPLTDEPVTIVAFGSLPFHEDDVGHLTKDLLEKVEAYISKFGITHK